MKLILQLFSWKSCLRLSIGVLALLVIFNFYGLYTNKFYFFKPDNYIFPLLSIVHFIYLYALWFKISERETADAPMRNLEYALYVIVLIYIFKLVDTLYILLSYSDYSNHIIPDTFLPMGMIILLLQLLLLGLTLLSFVYRKAEVGEYNFDNINGNIDPWP